MQHAVRDIWFFADTRASSSAPVTFAVEFAKRHGATLTFVSVTEPTDDRLLRAPIGQDLVRMLAEDKLQHMLAMEADAQHELPTGRVQHVVLQGEVGWHTLTRHALTNLPDLIVLAAQDDASTDSFGSVSHHLFRKCPVPVWSIPSDLHDFPGRALIALQPGENASDHRLLSRELLRLAVILTAGTGIELHVGHAWELWGEQMIASKYGEEGTRSLLALQHEYARESMEQLMSEARCQELLAGVHFVKGKPRDAIPQLAQDLGAGVVFLGSAARRGLDGFFIGSVAEAIIGRLECSALVVKRPGFVSPVLAASSSPLRH